MAATGRDFSLWFRRRKRLAMWHQRHLDKPAALQPPIFSESPIAAMIDHLFTSPERWLGSAHFAKWGACKRDRPIVSEILKFPDNVLRMSKNKTPEGNCQSCLWNERRDGGQDAKSAHPCDDGSSVERIHQAAQARRAAGIYGRRVEAYKSLLPAHWRRMTLKRAPRLTLGA